MQKHKVTITDHGFDIKPSKEYQDKKVREERIKEFKVKQKITNADIAQMLSDISDRQSEIYDMLKQNTK